MLLIGGKLIVKKWRIFLSFQKSEELLDIFHEILVIFERFWDVLEVFLNVILGKLGVFKFPRVRVLKGFDQLLTFFGTV